MLSKKIDFVDFDGNEQSEVFHFNLTEAELAELEMSTVGGLQQKIKEIIEQNDAPAMLALWKNLLLKCYGVKSADGRRFVKTPELTTEFSQTQAYSILFMELSTSAEAAAAFVNAVVPKIKKS